MFTALDTLMRKGELLTLRWKDFEIARRTIREAAINSKSVSAGEIGMTPRVSDVFSQLWEHIPKFEK
jgi:integrase